MFTKNRPFDLSQLIATLSMHRRVGRNNFAGPLNKFTVIGGGGATVALFTTIICSVQIVIE
jgi:hypothetical protein